MVETSRNLEICSRFASPHKRTTRTNTTTTDQHLSNFGAWKNRANEIVWSVNDFDEGLIYDFNLDIWRLAVSVFSHARGLGLSGNLGKSKRIPKKAAKAARKAVKTLCDSYVRAVESYVGNSKVCPERSELEPYKSRDDTQLTEASFARARRCAPPRTRVIQAELFEITETNARGELRDFLQETGREEGREQQLHDLTVRYANGSRMFDYASQPDLLPADDDTRAAVVEAMDAQHYGATLQKVAWHAVPFTPTFFQVLDVAKRLNSGDGSFGVERYFVLIRGAEAKTNASRHNIILDVKREPHCAARAVMGSAMLAWHDNVFANAGARSALVQRKLTCYVGSGRLMCMVWGVCVGGLFLSFSISFSLSFSLFLSLFLSLSLSLSLLHTHT